MSVKHTPAHIRARPQKISRNLLAYIVLSVGLTLLAMWSIHTFIYRRTLRLSETLLATFRTPAYGRTSIRSIRIGDTISLPVIESGYVNGAWLISPDKANHVARSASPGTAGNIIIYAHNTANMFGPLTRLTGGEVVSLTTSDEIIHRYTVISVAEVSPEDTALLRPTISETLTLYTCSGFLDSKRFVVRAVPDPAY